MSDSEPPEAGAPEGEEPKADAAPEKRPPHGGSAAPSRPLDAPPRTSAPKNKAALDNFVRIVQTHLDDAPRVEFLTAEELEAQREAEAVRWARMDLSRYRRKTETGTPSPDEPTPQAQPGDEPRSPARQAPEHPAASGLAGRDDPPPLQPDPPRGPDSAPPPAPAPAFRRRPRPPQPPPGQREQPAAGTSPGPEHPAPDPAWRRNLRRRELPTPENSWIASQPEFQRVWGAGVVRGADPAEPEPTPPEPAEPAPEPEAPAVPRAFRPRKRPADISTLLARYTRQKRDPDPPPIAPKPAAPKQAAPKPDATTDASRPPRADPAPRPAQPRRDAPAAPPHPPAPATPQGTAGGHAGFVSTPRSVPTGMVLAPPAPVPASHGLTGSTGGGAVRPPPPAPPSPPPLPPQGGPEPRGSHAVPADLGPTPEPEPELVPELEPEQTPVPPDTDPPLEYDTEAGDRDWTVDEPETDQRSEQGDGRVFDDPVDGGETGQWDSPADGERADGEADSQWEPGGEDAWSDEQEDWNDDDADDDVEDTEEFEDGSEWAEDDDDWRQEPYYEPRPEPVRFTGPHPYPVSRPPAEWTPAADRQIFEPWQDKSRGGSLIPWLLVLAFVAAIGAGGYFAWTTRIDGVEMAFQWPIFGQGADTAPAASPPDPAPDRPQAGSETTGPAGTDTPEGEATPSASAGARPRQQDDPAQRTTVLYWRPKTVTRFPALTEAELLAQPGPPVPAGESVMAPSAPEAAEEAPAGADRGVAGEISELLQSTATGTAPVSAADLESTLQQVGQLARTSEYGRAQEILRGLVSEFPDDARVQLLWGRVQLARADALAAVRAFDAVLASEPDNNVARAGRGFALLNLGLERESEAIADQILEAAPDFGPARLVKAEALAGSGALDLGLRQCDEFQATGVPDGAAEWCRGAVFKRGGRFLEAQERFAGALATGDEDFVRDIQRYFRFKGYITGQADGVYKDTLLRAVTKCSVARDCNALTL